MSTITPDQLASASFPHAVSQISVRETHISIVVLTGEFAYKIKKALHLDFIDAGSLERRRVLCEEELRLNRRFAPDLYLDVAAITRSNGGLAFGAEGEPIEYAVRMREFDPAEELQTLLAADRVNAAEIAELAGSVADFHKAAITSHTGSGYACTDAFVRLARANIENVVQRAPLVGAGALVSELARWTGDELAHQGERLRERERDGFIRECHGDLHARNIVRWRGRLTPFDCIEFDPALRFIDVLNDIAFLIMDLIHRERTDFAYTFLNTYLERTGDYAGADLLPCYLVYRALVRAKVDLIAVGQQPEAQALRERALSRLHTAALFTQRRQQVLIAMHGASGSGKSWLSERLAPQLPAVRIRSDLERKRLAGVDPPAPSTPAAAEAIYTRQFNERTYAHLLGCARACLRGGFNTIVDAVFLDANERRAFARLASEQAAEFLIVDCGADRETMATRIEQRRHARHDPSDATVEVLDRQLAAMQPFGADEHPHLLHVDTREPDALARVLRRAATSAGC